MTFCAMYQGVGLGYDFLRHVERTKVLLHVLDVSGTDGRDPIDDFEKINFELKEYSDKLARRKQLVVANKMDLPKKALKLCRYRQQLATVCRH